MAIYNGWTNFETWKVNLEIFDGWDSDYLDADEAQDIAEQYYLDGLECNGLAHSVVSLFLSEVNWYEIAAVHTEDNDND